MPTEKQRDAWTKVIEVYKELSYMYDKTNKHYFNRDMRHEGYKMMLQAYHEETGDDIMTVEHLKKKLENMRTSYGRELKKVNASKKSGWGPDDVYAPTLWYFYLFDFLEEMTESGHTGIDTLDETNNIESPASGDSSSDNEQLLVVEVPRTTPPPKKPKITNPRTLSSNRPPTTQKQEDWEIIGRSIGVQMKDLSKHQQVIVQKIVSDAIFYGKLGKLTEESVITLKPQRNACPCFPSDSSKKTSSPQQSPKRSRR